MATSCRGNHAKRVMVAHPAGGHIGPPLQQPVWFWLWRVRRLSPNEYRHVGTKGPDCRGGSRTAPTPGSRAGIISPLEIGEKVYSFCPRFSPVTKRIWKETEKQMRVPKTLQSCNRSGTGPGAWGGKKTPDFFAFPDPIESRSFLASLLGGG